MPINDHLYEPVLQFARTDFPVLNSKLNVGKALEAIRQQDIGERLIYFYVTNDDDQLVGIIPTRRLLSSEPDVPLKSIMQERVITLSDTATVKEACTLFANHKYLAFPITDNKGCLKGIVDISFFNREQLSFAQRQEIEDAFQLIGFSLSEVSNKSAIGTFRYRFPWLIATIGGGTLCAILCGQYEQALQTMIVLAFFLTLVLGLGESVSMQSMTVVIQRLHVSKASWSNYFLWLRQEIVSGLLVGIAAGILVGAIAFFWRGNPVAATVISTSIVLSIVSACVLGLSIPMLLHAIHEDTKIAAGPITLAVADLTTLSIYLNSAGLAISL